MVVSPSHEQKDHDIYYNNGFNKANISLDGIAFMFGYATDEAPELMLLTHVLATKFGERLTEVRKSGTCPWLRPDGKTQVTTVPIRVHTILISTQHDKTVTNDEIAAALKEHVIKPVIPDKYLYEKTIFNLNPSGHSVIGGPDGDDGLTGHKIIVGRTLLWSGFRSSSGRGRLLDLSSPEMADPPFSKKEI